MAHFINFYFSIGIPCSVCSLKLNENINFILLQCKNAHFTLKFANIK